MKAPLIYRSLLYTTPIAAMLLCASVFAQQIPQYTDVDGDGVISAEEIIWVHDALRADRILQYDTDGNGELSRSERRIMKDAAYDQALLEFDADGDGELSRMERRVSRDARRLRVDTQLDVNQDGEVTAAERAGFEQVMEQRGARQHSKQGNGG